MQRDHTCSPGRRVLAALCNTQSFFGSFTKDRKITLLDRCKSLQPCVPYVGNGKEETKYKKQKRESDRARENGLLLKQKGTLKTTYQAKSAQGTFPAAS